MYLTSAGVQGNPVQMVSQEHFKSVHITNLLHGADGEGLVDLSAETLDLDTDIGALLDRLIAVIRPLGRRCVRIEFDVARNHLRCIRP